MMLILCMCLVKECWELEEVIGTSYTESGRNANDVTSRDKDQLNILVDLCVYNVDLGVCMCVSFLVLSLLTW